MLCSFAKYNTNFLEKSEGSDQLLEKASFGKNKLNFQSDDDLCANKESYRCIVWCISVVAMCFIGKYRIGHFDIFN